MDANGIWADDQLGRRPEAIALEKFLIGEINQILKSSKKQSYVLALDAPYGQGKSWFLEHFQKHLSLNYPVATVDAWADDSGETPLIALIAAVQAALKPHFKKAKVKQNFVGATSAIGTVVLKGLTGAAGKAAGKYLGDDFSADASDAISSGIAEALEKGSEDAAAALQNVTDKVTDRAIAAYQKQKASIGHFKKQLGAAIGAIDKNSDTPIFIIIDELDRCRPTYAIKMLEEIKHLFDIPGIIFIIALHGDQLEHSVKAVYGETFESADYLSRFFSRKYRLKYLGIGQLAKIHIDPNIVTNQKFRWPSFYHSGSLGQHELPIVLTKVLESWSVTPREAIQIFDALRIWDSLWDENFKTELVPALAFIVSFVRGRQNYSADVLRQVSSPVVFPIGTSENKNLNPTQLIEAYQQFYTAPLSERIYKHEGINPRMWLWQGMLEEANARYPGQQGMPDSVRSKYIEYNEIAATVGRFTDISEAD